jgi:hypothetical protein
MYYWTQKCVNTIQAFSSQSAKLFPSELWDSPTPLTSRRVCKCSLPLVPGEGHTRMRERGWGVPIGQGDRHHVAL